MYVYDMIVWLLVSSSCVYFFFKHKTAYGLRFSDCSSAVCSSDLSIVSLAALHGANGALGFVRCDREASFVPVELEADCEDVLAWVRHRDLGKALEDRKSVV